MVWLMNLVMLHQARSFEGAFLYSTAFVTFTVLLRNRVRRTQS
jgi:hypothetical protein